MFKLYTISQAGGQTLLKCWWLGGHLPATLLKWPRLSEKGEVGSPSWRTSDSFARPDGHGWSGRNNKWCTGYSGGSSSWIPACHGKAAFGYRPAARNEQNPDLCRASSSRGWRNAPFGNKEFQPKVRSPRSPLWEWNRWVGLAFSKTVVKRKSPNALKGPPLEKKGAKPDLPINAAYVVHKTACKHGLADKGCQYADKCRFAHAVLRAKDGRCFNCSGKGHSRRECASGKRSESRESQSESEQDGDAGAPESIEGGLDEAETAVQIIPEDAQAVQEVNHLLKGIAGPMLKSVGISKLKEQVSSMEVLRTPSEREPATRSRTQCRSRLNWLTEPRSSTKIPWMERFYRRHR